MQLGKNEHRKSVEIESNVTIFFFLNIQYLLFTNFEDNLSVCSCEMAHKHIQKKKLTILPSLDQIFIVHHFWISELFFVANTCERKRMNVADAPRQHGICNVGTIFVNVNGMGKPYTIRRIGYQSFYPLWIFS